MDAAGVVDVLVVLTTAGIVAVGVRNGAGALRRIRAERPTDAALPHVGGPAADVADILPGLLGRWRALLEETEARHGAGTVPRPRTDTGDPVADRPTVDLDGLDADLARLETDIQQIRKELRALHEDRHGRVARLQRTAWWTDVGLAVGSMLVSAAAVVVAGWVVLAGGLGG